MKLYAKYMITLGFLVSYITPSSKAEPAPGRRIVLDEKDRNRRNGILFARVAVNEDPRVLRSKKDGGTGGRPSADSWALLQEIVEFARWKKVSFRRSLHWQMPRITGLKPPLEGLNQVWTSRLPLTGRKKPSTWVGCGSVTEGKCHGDWSKYSKNWARFRDWALRTVSGGEFEAACSGHPITWGFHEDDHLGIKRGLCVLTDCGRSNTFWTFPGRGCDEPMREVLRRQRISPRKLKKVGAKKIMLQLQKTRTD